MPQEVSREYPDIPPLYGEGHPLDFISLGESKKAVEERPYSESGKYLYLDEQFREALLEVSSHFSTIQTGDAIPSTNSFNSSRPIRISHKVDGTVTCNKNTLRIGKVVKALLPTLKDEEVEEIVSAWKSKYKVDTSIVQVTKDVHMAYDMGYIGGSCMSQKDSTYFELYRDIQSKVAYIEGKARALIHTCINQTTGEELVIMDRIFFGDELSKLTLQKWRKEQEGMTRFQYLDGVDVRSKLPIGHKYESVPYLDSLYNVREVGGAYYVSNSTEFGNYVDTLQETDGSSMDRYIAEGDMEDYVYCVDTDESVHIEDAFYCEGTDEYYQYEDDLVWLVTDRGYDGYYHIEDDNIARDEELGDYAWKSQLSYCESEDLYTSSDDYCYVEMGEYAGSYEHIDGLTYCEDIGGLVMSEEATYVEDTAESHYHTDDLFIHSDGKYYTEEEDTEEV